MQIPAGQVLDGLHQMHGVDAVLLHEVHLAGTVGIAGQTDLHQPLADAVFGDELGHGAAQTADIVLVLDGDHAVLDLLQSLHDGGVGEGLQSGDMHMLDGHAPILQCGGGAHGLLGADAGGEDEHIVALAQHPGAVELHGLIGGEQAGYLLAEHADKDGAIVVIGQLEHALDFGGVADVENRHVGHGAQHAHIVDGLVGHAAGGGDAGDKAHKDHRQVGVSHAHLQLIQNAAVQEHGEGVQEGTIALPGQTGRPGAHILLGNAHGQVAVGIGGAELLDLAGRTQIGGEYQHLGVLGGKVDHAALMSVQFDFHAPFLLTARRRSSGTLPGRPRGCGQSAGRATFSPAAECRWCRGCGRSQPADGRGVRWRRRG